MGEIDRLMLDARRDTLVVVEVKAAAFGAGAAPAQGAYRPEVHLNRDKQRTLGRLARWVVQQPAWRDAAVRIDVVGVDWPVSAAPAVRHHPHAVSIPK